jgi:hypothetical protein
MSCKEKATRPNVRRHRIKLGRRQNGEVDNAIIPHSLKYLFPEEDITHKPTVLIPKKKKKGKKTCSACHSQRQGKSDITNYNRYHRL